MRLLLLAVLSMITAACFHHGPHSHGHGGPPPEPPHPPHPPSAEGRHGNPADLDGYIARLESPERAEWQKPDAVVQALALAPGATACDIGAGPGYFSLRLASAVGPEGTVYAVDVEPGILSVLRERLARSTTRNVVPVLALPDDPLVPARACDVVLIVNTLHHFPDPVSYLARLGRSLKPGGRLVNIDYHKRETPMGPPLEARLDRVEFLGMAEQAGLEVVAEHGMLPYQYFVELRVK